MKMVLIVITVVLIALFLVIVGGFLFAIAVLLGGIADNRAPRTRQEVAM
jgi:hypothetical protein